MYKSLLVGLMAMVMGTGCMKVTYSTGLPASGAGSKEKQVFLLWGLLAHLPLMVFASEACCKLGAAVKTAPSA